MLSSAYPPLGSATTQQRIETPTDALPSLRCPASVPVSIGCRLRLRSDHGGCAPPQKQHNNRFEETVGLSTLEGGQRHHAGERMTNAGRHAPTLRANWGGAVPSQAVHCS